MEQVTSSMSHAGNRANLAGLDVELVVGDICDRAVVDRSLEGADAVVHFAAESHVTRSEKDPDVFFQTNVAGTRTLLEAADRHRLDRFVHVSTDEVYGDARGRDAFREDEKETGDHQATSAYPKSKSLADDLAMSVGVSVVRPTNNFGPRQFPEKAFPRWVTRLLRDEPISLWGVGDQVRDWLYAPDNARAIDLALRTGAPGQAYNIGANHEREIANRDLAHWLAGRNHERRARSAERGSSISSTPASTMTSATESTRPRSARSAGARRRTSGLSSTRRFAGTPTTNHGGVHSCRRSSASTAERPRRGARRSGRVPAICDTQTPRGDGWSRGAELGQWWCVPKSGPVA